LVFVFTLTHVIPADPARAAMGQFASEETVAKYRREHGLDRPLLEQFLVYLQRLSRGDLGKSITTTRDVRDELGTPIPATVELVIPALLISTIFGVLPGIISAANSGRLVDHGARVLSLFGMSMPVFWLGVVMQLVFFLWLEVLPIGGRLSHGIPVPPHRTGLYTVDALLSGNWTTFVDATWHLVLPAVVLATGPLAVTSRISRTALLEQLVADYVRAARSKGLTHTAVLFKHALPNALIPIITVIGLQLGSMLGGTVIVETIFSWPGVGSRAVQSLRAVDYPVVMGFTLYMILVYSLINLAVDLSYHLIDPRIRQSHEH
jgi:peptide/nickel transport system permease protein